MSFVIWITTIALRFAGWIFALGSLAMTVGLVGNKANPVGIALGVGLIAVGRWLNNSRLAAKHSRAQRRMDRIESRGR